MRLDELLLRSWHADANEQILARSTGEGRNTNYY
jgi:hypothetical protein